MSARIGTVLFTDGQERPVFEDEQGQFVIDDDGERLDGVWIYLSDPYIVISRQGPRVEL